MITPEEIKRQALKWWIPILQSHIAGETYFPKSLDRIGKVQSGHVTLRFDALQQEIESLYRNSKTYTGTGYSVRTTEKTFRRTGNHELPDSIEFDSMEDYIAFVGKKKEWKLFLSNYALLVTKIPDLKRWASDNCFWLTEQSLDWSNVLNVCQYFLGSPRPDLYIRQLPVDIHTKFIEEHASVMLSLLDFLIPGHIRNADQKRFAERYFLKYDQPLIRIRILDKSQSLAGKLSDISIPLYDFVHTHWPAENVLIAENKMNFLTIPNLPSTIAVWSGGGFNISHLRGAEWLKNLNIFYWGDIDEHGFQILHQLRSYFPHAKSVMMDRYTFELFGEFAGNGSRNKYEHLVLLDNDETKLYQHLKSLESKNRLEQEKIPQVYVDQVLHSLIGKENNG